MKKNNSPISRRAIVAGIGGLAALGTMGWRSPRAQPAAQHQLLYDRFLKRISLTEPEEAQLGGELEKSMIRASGGPYLNRSIQAAIESFALPLFEVSSKQLFTWKISVVDNETPGAWVLPGGKIGIHKGLLRYTETADELATIIAHEMGHAELSHLTAVMRKRDFADTLSDHAVESMLQEIQEKGSTGVLSRPALRVFKDPIYRVIRSGYGAEREEAADDQILRIFRQTGHDLSQGAVIFDKISRLIPAGRIGTNCLFNGPGTASARMARLVIQSRSSTLTSRAPYNRGFQELKNAFPTRNFYRYRSADEALES